MADAREIAVDDISTEALQAVMSLDLGDAIYTIPVNDFQVFTRLRPDANPHL